MPQVVVIGGDSMAIMGLSKKEISEALSQGRITICVVGLGRIGLPTAAKFAQAGAQVIGADINSVIAKLVNSGRCPFQDEPGLAALVETVVRNRKLSAIVDCSSAVKKAEIVIICVPTPVDESRVPDYSSIRIACDSIAKTLNKGSLIIVESTVGPGTVENLIIPQMEQKTGMTAGIDFGIASCPERADPGKILHDLENVTRIVGGIDKRSTEIATTLYEAALGVKVVNVKNPQVANAVKLTENLFRDVNIALANELALLYEKLGIDTIEVIEACKTKYNFMPHYPGAGVGGPCLPQNSYYLIVEGMKVGNIPYLIRMAREINDRMPDHVVTLVSEALNDVGKTVQGSKIAILGVAYKPNIHDLQLTPMEKVYNRLCEMGSSLRIYDPMFKGEDVFGSRVSENLVDAIKDVDCIVIGTAHREFRHSDLTTLSQTCSMPAALVDTRDVVDPLIVKKHGFSYRGVGRR